MKVHIVLSILLLLSLICISREPETTALQEKQKCTQIYIINGDHEDHDWFDGPSKSELQRALIEYAPHLFITPSLWQSFCSHRNAQSKKLKKIQILPSLENLEVKEGIIYNTKTKTQKNAKKYSQDDLDFFHLATLVAFDEDDWEFYDTHAGLYYLRPKDDIQDIGLKIESFTKIDHPCLMKAKSSKSSWVKKFIDLFDIQKWNTAHPKHKKKVICISGHGTSRKCKVPRACGVSPDDFTELLFFFNDTLKIHTLGVQSCYWPSKRILELTSNKNRTTFDFQLITPINKEVPLNYPTEMPLVWSYDPITKNALIQDTKPGELLFTGLPEIATSFNGKMTDALSETINQIQVVQINHSYNMKTSLIDAGSKELILV